MEINVATMSKDEYGNQKNDDGVIVFNPIELTAFAIGENSWYRQTIVCDAVYETVIRYRRKLFLTNNSWDFFGWPVFWFIRSSWKESHQITPAKTKSTYVECSLIFKNGRTHNLLIKPKDISAIKKEMKIIT